MLDMSDEKSMYIKWMIRTLLLDDLKIDTKAADVFMNSCGVTIFVKDKMFTVSPPSGTSDTEIAKNVILMLVNKYPELSL